MTNINYLGTDLVFAVVDLKLRRVCDDAQYNNVGHEKRLGDYVMSRYLLR